MNLTPASVILFFSFFLFVCLIIFLLFRIGRIPTLVFLTALWFVLGLYDFAIWAYGIAFLWIFPEAITTFILLTGLPLAAIWLTVIALSFLVRNNSQNNPPPPVMTRQTPRSFSDPPDNNRPNTPPSKPRDTPTALNAMQLANAYLDELVAAREEKRETPAADQLNTLSLVSKQLKRAEASDPDAVYNHTDEENRTYPITLNELKSEALYAEAFVRNYDLSEHGRAIACLNQATALTPERSDLHYMLGMIYSEYKQKARAIEALQKAFDLRPKDMNYRMALDRAQNISGAARLIEVAVKGVSLASFLFKAITTIFFLMCAALFAVVIVQRARGNRADRAHHPTNPVGRELHTNACSPRKRHSCVSSGGMRSASPFHCAGKVLILSE
jgi:tetratricopeptide (TPR) repeat protein